MPTISRDVQPRPNVPNPWSQSFSRSYGSTRHFRMLEGWTRSYTCVPNYERDKSIAATEQHTWQYMTTCVNPYRQQEAYTWPSGHEVFELYRMPTVVIDRGLCVLLDSVFDISSRHPFLLSFQSSDSPPLSLTIYLPWARQTSSGTWTTPPGANPYNRAKFLNFFPPNAGQHVPASQRGCRSQVWRWPGLIWC